MTAEPQEIASGMVRCGYFSRSNRISVARYNKSSGASMPTDE